MISRKSIRVVVMVAALFALLTGCGNDDDEKPSGGPESLGGHVGENPFKGLTIVYENEEDSITKTFSFTSDTTGVYVYKREWKDDYEQYDFEYAVDSTKGLLKYRLTTYTDSDGTQTMDEMIAEEFDGIDEETKSLIEAFIHYEYYKFTDDGVELTADYFGNMKESDADFYHYDSAQGTEFHFGREIRISGESYNFAWPKFTDGDSFTANVLKENVYYDKETHAGTHTYTKLFPPLEGTYQISGTGTNCTGTVTFSQLPVGLTDKNGNSFAIGKPYAVRQLNSSPSLYTIQK